MHGHQLAVYTNTGCKIMAVFAVTDQDNLLEAVNYALANLGQSTGGTGTDGNALTVNTSTGIISQGGSTTAISYLYQYLNIRYADSSDGNTNFSTSPTNRLYFGVRNTAVSNPTDGSNPANYVWYAVTGGFGTTKQLYYTTFGGRQIQITATTTSPGVFFTTVTDSTPIDLDIVLSTQAQPIVIVTVFRRGTSAPATPTGGTYDFNNVTLTPPAGWSASVPAGTDPYYTSTNTFTAPSSGTVAGPDLAWTTPQQSGANGTSVFIYTVFQQAATIPSTPGASGSYNFGTATGTPPTGWTNSPVSTNLNPIWATAAQAYSSDPEGTWVAIAGSWSTPVQYTGAGGVDGERGFIPMGYVLTTQNPTTSPGNTQANLTAAFSAARTNVVAPIGTGYAPISGDTASFTWESNTAVNTVYTYSSGNVWQPADGQIINGNVFVTGSVNAAKLNANDVYALNLRGGNVTVGTYSGTGYWFQASTGNAYVAGNLVIGNNANIGNNLTIGNSVTIQGVTLNGALVANIVSASQLTPNAVVAGKIAADAVTAGTIASGGVVAGDIASGAVTNGTIATGAVTAGTIAAGAVTAGTIAADAVTAGTIAAGAVQANSISANTMSGNIIVANTMAGNVIIANTLSGDAVIANTLNASKITANTITATQISSAYIYAGNIVSFGANVGNTSSPGYWLAYNSGDARFGGNVSIGANLNVQGLITTGALQSNTVVTTTIQPNQISGGSVGVAGSGSSPFFINNPPASTEQLTDMFLFFNTTQLNQPVYLWGSLNSIVTVNLGAFSFIGFVTILVRQYNPPVGTPVLTFISQVPSNEIQNLTGTPLVGASYNIDAQFAGFTDIPAVVGSYTYGIVVYWYVVSGTGTVTQVECLDRNLLAQTLKR